MPVDFCFRGLQGLRRADMEKLGVVENKAKPAAALRQIEKVAQRKFFARFAGKNFAADDRNATEHVGITGGFGGVAFDFSAGADAVVADAFVAADVF